MKDNYRWLAPVYTPLSRMVFGNQLHEAKTCFLSNIPNKKVLILGGGDGWDYRGFQENLTGKFVELSPSMLSKAEKNLKDSKLDFVPATVGMGPFDFKEKYDVILLPFVLDTFTDQDLELFFSKVKDSLNYGGEVILADFFPSQNWRQEVMIKTIISGFRMLARHVRQDLPDYEYFFKSIGMEKVEERIWRKGWIKAQIWR